MEMARHLPVSTLAEQLDETDTRLWRSVAHYVDEARRLEDYMGVEAIGIDETSRRGRNCITVVADLVEHARRERARVLRRLGERQVHERVEQVADELLAAAALRRERHRARGDDRGLRRRCGSLGLRDEFQDRARHDAERAFGAYPEVAHVVSRRILA